MTGPGGRSLAQFWDEHRLQAYEGVSVPGFPELLHRVRALRLRRVVVLRAHRGADPPHRPLPRRRPAARGATRVEVTGEANDRFFAEMMRKRHRQIFWQDSCQHANSYYFDKQRRRAVAADHHGRGVLAQPPLPVVGLRVQPEYDFARALKHGVLTSIVRRDALRPSRRCGSAGLSSRIVVRRSSSGPRPCRAAPTAGRRRCGRSDRRRRSARRSGAAGPGRGRSRRDAGRTPR